tara:strand:- start:886 stop:1179 length:294 start_codon:yes stop_codon:yes gene_type:complete
MAKKEKEKEIDLKVKAEKISEEHLKQMQQLVNTINSLQFNIGKLETSKHQLLHNLGITQDRINVFQDTLKKEYGTFDVNLEDGKINWPKEEKEGDEK